MLLYLVGFVEEVLYAFGQAADQAKRVAEHVEAEHQDVHLFDGLLRVVPCNLSRQLALVVERVVTLKVAQPDSKRERNW